MLTRSEKARNDGRRRTRGRPRTSAGGGERRGRRSGAQWAPRGSGLDEGEGGRERQPGWEIRGCRSGHGATGCGVGSVCASRATPRRGSRAGRSAGRSSRSRRPDRRGEAPTSASGGLRRCRDRRGAACAPRLRAWGRGSAAPAVRRCAVRFAWEDTRARSRKIAQRGGVDVARSARRALRRRWPGGARPSRLRSSSQAAPSSPTPQRTAARSANGSRPAGRRVLGEAFDGMRQGSAGMGHDGSSKTKQRGAARPPGRHRPCGASPPALLRSIMPIPADFVDTVERFAELALLADPPIAPPSAAPSSPTPQRTAARSANGSASRAESSAKRSTVSTGSADGKRWLLEDRAGPRRRTGVRCRDVDGRAAPARCGRLDPL